MGTDMANKGVNRDWSWSQGRLAESHLMKSSELQNQSEVGSTGFGSVFGVVCMQLLAIHVRMYVGMYVFIYRNYARCVRWLSAACSLVLRPER